jgi:hypothetical protein
LNEGKKIVPFILHGGSDDSIEQLVNEFGFHPVGSAAGEGFTCYVYKKDIDLSAPIYVITGELDISVDEFHALACDIDFRHRWDDQFHHVEASALEPDSILSSPSLMRWIVKWPWPLAPREYNYILKPYVLDDGTKLVMAASIDRVDFCGTSPTDVVPVKEYFGITAAIGISHGKCRYCVFHFDDPRMGKVPKWIESYVSKTLLPSFPKNILVGASKYPKERLVIFSSHYNKSPRS